MLSPTSLAPLSWRLPAHRPARCCAVLQLEAEQRRAGEVESFYKQRAAGQVRLPAAGRGCTVFKGWHLACCGSAWYCASFRLLCSRLPPQLPAFELVWCALFSFPPLYSCCPAGCTGRRLQEERGRLVRPRGSGSYRWVLQAGQCWAAPGSGHAACLTQPACWPADMYAPVCPFVSGGGTVFKPLAGVVRSLPAPIRWVQYSCALAACC